MLWLLMKLVTPPLEPDPNDPFREDVLNRKGSAHALLNLVKNFEDSMVITLDAPWGCGKSTFAKKWQHLLEMSYIPVINIDAFRYDFNDDPFVLITSAVCEHHAKIVEKKKVTSKGGKQFLKTTGKVAQVLGCKVLK